MSTTSPCRPLAVFLMGPTASGKTELAVRLVQALPCEIISVDSALVYRGMDIGTAKPGPQILGKAPHRLIDVCDPGESYSAARFREDALREMADIRGAGRIPLLVGGTMLYFRALERGLSILPEADPGVRADIERDAAVQGWGALHRRLAALDPVAAQRIHPNDPQRIQRALEVCALTGRPMSQLQGRDRDRPFPYRALKLARAPGERALLHWRIERRFLQMLEDGLEAEVQGLLARGDLAPATPSLRAVGYRQVVAHLLGEYGREEMIGRAVAATRQLAKRQLTWLRSDPEVIWLRDEDGDPLDRALKMIRAALSL